MLCLLHRARGVLTGMLLHTQGRTPIPCQAPRPLPKEKLYEAGSERNEKFDLEGAQLGPYWGKTVSQRLSYHPSAHTPARARCMKLRGRL